jgi:hypothetical protein
MQRKHHKITFKSYLDFLQLLQNYIGTHEENRLFALKREHLLKKPKAMLLLWLNSHAFRIPKVISSEKFLGHIGVATNFLGLFAIVIGFFTGMGLLSYSGQEPVNIVYYLFFAMIFPLTSMMLTLLSIFSRGKFLNFFTLLSPLYWIEKIFIFFSFKQQFDLLKESISAKLQKWIFLKRLQLLSLLFSIGLFISLIFMVISQDIAFSWSTTLDISSESFHEFLITLALPWREVLPSTIPSLELVEMSQHYRLGVRLDNAMVAHAEKLGAWWKYLAIATFFYAIVLRSLFYLFTTYTLQKVLEQEFLNLHGVHRLLREFRTPFVSTKAPKVEQHLKIQEETKSHIKEFVELVEESYTHIIGWNFSSDEIILVNDSKNLNAFFIDSVGGNHTFEEDEKRAKGAKDRVLLYVKSWEPPTMDFVDFLEELIHNKKVKEIEVLLLGTLENGYNYSQKELTIWNRKIEGLGSKKVWVIDAK